MQGQAGSGKVHQLTTDLYWREVSEDNFEDALALLLSTFTQNPGNPGIVSLGYTSEDLEKIWRPKLRSLVQKASDPNNALCQMLFYYKQKPAAFLYYHDLQDEYDGFKNISSDDPRWRWKLSVDKLVMQKAAEQFPKRGVFSHGWMGVSPVTGFEGLSRLIDLELRLQIGARGWHYLGSNTYNPKMVSMFKRNQGFVISDVDIDTLEYQGRKVFKEYKEPVVVTYLATPIDEETVRKHFPQLLPRFYQIKSSLALQNKNQAQPKL